MSSTVEPKAKKTKVQKAKSVKTPSHPPYFQMIKEALLALNEKNGSSPHAIGKYMENKHKAVLPDNFRKMLSLQLKNSASKGKLIKVKASYKLSDVAKKKTTAGPKKPATSAARATASVANVGGSKKAAVGKKENKIRTPKKRKVTPGKAKQPKSIKSSVAKRARKASV